MYCVNLIEACELAKKVYPDLRDTVFLIPDQGGENFTLLTKNEVVRIARYPHIAKCMELEVQTLHALEGGLSLATPIVADYQPEFNIMRMSRLPGRPLSRDRLQRLSDMEREEIAAKLGKFMAELHHKFSTDRSFLKDAFRSHREDALTKANFLKEKNVDIAIQRHLEKLRTYILGYEDIADDCVRIHADIKGDNVLYNDETKQLSIVDFTGCRHGFRHQEFRITMSFFPPEFAKSLLNTYEAASGKSVSRLAHMWRDLVKVAEHTMDNPDPFTVDTPIMYLAP